MSVDISFPKSAKALPVVIYAHGINGFKDWGGMDLIAQKFAEAGFAFLKFNFSHNGTTPARPTEFFDLEAYKEDSYLKRQKDLERILKFVESPHPELELDSENIFLIGHSRGGADAILATAKDARIKALITWAAVSHARTPWDQLSPEEIKDWAEQGYFTRKNGRTAQDLPIGYSLYEEYKAHKADLDVEAAARAIKAPWLIIHGEEDEAVFIKHAYDLKQWQPEARVAVIPETGHTFDRQHPWNTTELPEASLKKVNRSIEFLQEVLSA
ncbi:alpha/beta hydrolase family protein [Croceimicrobium hydrocarbonivorans]|uniref:Alpha/beta fold hydrolase n=1 Tax=Croceimicrobium hydrocarbonivorans TaxID=2761580 RepID=A0A7H0VEI7_9FLAO|nr:alpha/beta fold hydrolase [Croceimicrobium hydrocarbonivorans]QNR24135.1 alpha/beta fold hydrolase [Croceimicrobium hydrocarbonivorans]